VPSTATATLSVPADATGSVVADVGVDPAAAGWLGWVPTTAAEAASYSVAAAAAGTGPHDRIIGELWDRLSVGDRGRLFGCAWEANVAATDIPNSSAASALLRIYGRNSTTADHAASLEAPSLGA
jgi:hypothetical protein